MIDMLRDIQTSDLTYRMGWTLVHSLWLGALVAGVLALVLPVLQRRGALARYTAACSALVIMVVGMGCVYWMIPPRTQEPQAQARVQFQGAGSAAHLPAVPMMAEPRPNVVMPAAPAIAAPQTAMAEVKVSEPLAVTANKFLAPAIPWVALAWGAGVLLLSVWQLSAWIAARRLCQVATQGAEEAILKSVSRLQQRLRVLKPVKVLRSMLVQVPMTVGWLRPVILLPASLATGLSSRQLEMLLVHELAHIRRMDYLVNLLQTLVETLLFYHPAVWYISRRIRTEREHCCDDVVLELCGDREVYAQALVACTGAAAQMAMASSGGNLLIRLRRILGVSSPPSMGRTWLAAPLTLIVIMAMIVVPLAYSAEKSPGPQAQPTTQPASRSGEQPITAPVETQTRNITGKIVDPDGKPIDDAEVLLLQFGKHMGFAYPIEQATVGRAQSDATGQFTVAVAGRHEDAFIMAVARKPDIGFGYTHVIGYPSKDGKMREIKLSKTAELTGVVVDNAGQPIVNAQVRADLYRDDQNNEPDVMGCPTLDWFAAQTDKDGRFVIPGIPSEYRVEFMVKSAGRATVYTQRRPSGDNALAAQFRAGQENIRIVLAPESRIEGVALAVNSQKPVAGVKLIAMRAELSRVLSEPGTLQLRLPPGYLTPPAIATTDKDGHFVLDGLLPGQWVVALAQQCTEERTESVEWVTKPVLVNLAAGKSQSLPVELSPGELVEVALINATTGKPLKGELSPERESWLSAGWGSQISDDKGIVHLRLLPGNYRFRTSDWPVPVVSGDEPAPKRLYGSVHLTVERGKSQRLEVPLREAATQP